MGTSGMDPRGSTTTPLANALLVFVILAGAGTGGIYLLGTGWFPTAAPTTAFDLGIEPGSDAGLDDPDGPGGDGERVVLTVAAGESVDTDGLTVSVGGRRVGPPGSNAPVRFAEPVPETLDAGDQLVVESGREGDHLFRSVQVRVVYRSWWSDRSVVLFEGRVG